MQQFKYIGVVSEVTPINGMAKPKVVVVMDKREYNGKEYAVRFDFYGEAESACAIGLTPGETVEIIFSLSGTKSTNGNWFVNLHGKMATVKSATPVAAASSAEAMQAAIAEYTAWRGEDKAGFAAFCKGLVKMPDGNPKPSNSYTVADWGTIVNAIRDAVAKTVAGGAASPSMAPDEMSWL